jgi:hypothetical protein
MRTAAASPSDPAHWLYGDTVESAIGGILRGGPFLLLCKSVDLTELADRVDALLHGADRRH